MKRIVKHELIEVVIPAASNATRFSLPDAQNLRNTQIWGLQVYYSQIIPNSIISAKKTITKTIFQQSFLTLQGYSGREFLKQSPFPIFQTIENNLSQFAEIECSEQEKDFKNFVGQRINYPKSYIDTVNIVSDPLVDLVYLISIYYTDNNDNFSKETFDNKN